MNRIDEVIEKIRSKNAGPFWVTIDIFCHATPGYQATLAVLDTNALAALLGCQPGAIRRFDIPELAVIKISLPRPQIQGTKQDRDMHGAAIAVLVEEHLAQLL